MTRPRSHRRTRQRTTPARFVVGDALTLTVTVATTGTASAAVHWASSAEAVATIAADGRVTTLTPGTSDVTAASTIEASKSGTITLTVNPLGLLGWARQFGTSRDDVAYGAAYGVASDAFGNVHVAGRTLGDLESGSAGSDGVFLRTYGQGPGGDAGVSPSPTTAHRSIGRRGCANHPAQAWRRTAGWGTVRP